MVISERLAVGLSLPVYTTSVCRGWESNTQPSACEAIWLKSDLYWWFNNSPLQMVFKWTLYGLCICILRHDFDHLDSVFYIVQYFSWGWKRFCCYVLVSLRACSLHRSRVQTFRNIFSRIEVTIWLVNIINTEHDQ